MANLNKVFLIGRLGQTPEKKSTTTGRTIVKVSLASNEYFNDRSGERKERTEWHRLVFWEKLADLVSEYCQKGSMLFIEGSLRNNEWQDKEGIKRSVTEVNVINMQFLDRAKARSETKHTSDYKPAEGPASSESSDFLDDDIPF